MEKWHQEAQSLLWWMHRVLQFGGCLEFPTEPRHGPKGVSATSDTTLTAIDREKGWTLLCSFICCTPNKVALL